jgi:hypothetical protein
MNINKTYVTLIVILLAGLAVRVYLFINDTFILADAVYYTHLGKNLIESGRYYFVENFNMGIFLPPGYPFFIGLTNLLFNDLFFSSKFVSLIASVITIFLFFIIGKKLYDDEAGLFAAFGFAAHPLIIRLSVFGNAESLFFCIFTLSIYLFILAIKRDNSLLFVLLGIPFAIAYLTKPEGLFALFLPFLYMVGFFGKRPALNRKTIFKFTMLLLIFVLFATPYLIFLKNSTGRFALTGKVKVNLMIAEEGGGKEFHELVGASGSVFHKVAFTLNETKDQLNGFDMNVKTSFIDSVLRNPVRFLKRYQKNIMQEIKIMIKLLIPIILPLFFAFFNRDLFRERTRLIFLFFPLLYFCVYPLFYIVERHMTIIVVFLILFSSGGFVTSSASFLDLTDFYKFERNKILIFFSKSIKFIIISVIILGSMSYLAFSNIGNWDIPIEHQKAGYFIKNNISPAYEELNIMDNYPYVSFYSDSRFTFIPYASIADVIHYAKIYKVDYFVVSERFSNNWEYYDELIQADKYSKDVELVYEDKTGQLIRIFKIKN